MVSEAFAYSVEYAFTAALATTMAPDLLTSEFRCRVMKSLVARFELPCRQANCSRCLFGELLLQLQLALL